MLWIIVIILIIVGVCINNFTPLKVFGKIIVWFFGIILGISLVSLLIPSLIAGKSPFEYKNNKKEQNSYLEHVMKTPLVQWACDSYGRQLHLGERPTYVYQCSTGELIAQGSPGIEVSYYTCMQKPRKTVNHWKFCKHKANLSNSKYNNLLGN